MITECSSQPYTINSLNSHALHQQTDSRVECRFGQLYSSYIILSDVYVLTAIMKNIGKCASLRYNVLTIFCPEFR